MKTIFNLKKKYILEKIKYFQILLIEKKENNILSKETRKNEKNGLNINKNYKSNMENDLNNNQVKTIQITESIELKSKEVEHIDFVYKEGGYGWVVG